MKGNGWMQRLLYFLILMLGIYIVYKGGSLFMKSPMAQTALDEGTLQRRLENAAARTWTGAYTAVLEGKDKIWSGGWFRAALPVYSYLITGNGITRESEPEADENTDQYREESKQESGRGPETESEPESGREPETENEPESGREPETEKELESGREPETEKEPESGRGSETESEPESGREPETEKEPESEEKRETETEEKQGDLEQSQEVLGRSVSPELFSQLEDFNFLINEYFTVDGGTTAIPELINAKSFLEENLSIVKNSEVPQILIYHTHSQEAFVDSVEGDAGTTIVGMGDVLADSLEKRGYQVIHDTGVYDLVDGVLDRSAAYDYARTAIEALLEKYPTIQVVIDLHRDGVDGKKFVTEIDGKPCSMVMFFNGISRNQQGELSYLPNPYVKQNLAFSFQMEFAARQRYPGFTRNIYLKAERFNLHLRPRSLLIEAGTQLNTVAEEQNAMEVLADLLDEVLS
mgnify:FL=1